MCCQYQAFQAKQPGHNIIIEGLLECFADQKVKNGRPVSGKNYTYLTRALKFRCNILTYMASGVCVCVGK